MHFSVVKGSAIITVSATTQLIAVTVKLSLTVFMCTVNLVLNDILIMAFTQAACEIFQYSLAEKSALSLINDMSPSITSNLAPIEEAGFLHIFTFNIFPWRFGTPQPHKTKIIDNGWMEVTLKQTDRLFQAWKFPHFQIL